MLNCDDAILPIKFAISINLMLSPHGCNIPLLLASVLVILFLVHHLMVALIITPFYLSVK
jgi:hypothetical protein